MRLYPPKLKALMQTTIHSLVAYLLGPAIRRLVIQTVIFQQCLRMQLLDCGPVQQVQYSGGILPLRLVVAESSWSISAQTHHRRKRMQDTEATTFLLFFFRLRSCPEEKKNRKKNFGNTSAVHNFGILFRNRDLHGYFSKTQFFSSRWFFF